MKNTLQELVRQIRGFTCHVLAMTNPAWLTWSPEGTSNHMLWHAGHVIWVQDRLCVERLTGKSELDQDWGRRFGMDCEPVDTQVDWPSVDIVKQFLGDQQHRLHNLIENMSSDQLVVDVDNDRDLVGGIIHGLHDEARHHGEMYLLHKICTARTSHER